MSQPPPLPRSPIALDDLIALTDEMAALVRAGVPLEHGLAQVARELRPSQSRLASELVRRMGEGESLLHILDASPGTFPPIYRAVVAAGIKSGRLPLALEGLASTARRMLELRQFVRSSMVYPICVALAAFGLLVAGLIYFQPRLAELYASMHTSQSSLNSRLTSLGQTAYLWAPAVLVVVVACGVLLWWLSSRNVIGGSSLSRLPPLMAWLLTTNSPPAALAESLRTSSEAYRRWATQLDDWLRLYLPLALTLLIGGTAVTIYALSMLGPWYEALVNIST